ncbi:MAG: hypothetical protein CMI54_06240 [Parcubacteria group bacterium]|jgi:hypothetical protein|nr:hypothetical protein [Parcubacteria group bacterium]|tara:strand:- start:19280 stop:19480 length:201 start_codon:yes stop_codon:yes gene_type:complete
MSVVSESERKQGQYFLYAEQWGVIFETLSRTYTISTQEINAHMVRCSRLAYAGRNAFKLKYKNYYK